MRTALYQLGEDFLSTIVFLIVYFVSGELYLAIAVAMAVGIGQFLLLKRRGRNPDIMGWLSLVMVIALGGASLITNDSRFIMAKPSVVHFAVGMVMLRRGWLARYMPEFVKQNVPENVLVGSGYAWAALYSIDVWAWFISVYAVGAKMIAFLLQYAVIWVMIRRKLRAAAISKSTAPLTP
jgi:intracellular septation protein